MTKKVNPALTRAALNRLTDQLGSAATAAEDLPRVIDVLLNFTPPTIDGKLADCVLAVAFGNRPNPAGSGSAPIPGPINAAIADAVLEVVMGRQLTVYAQAEVADVLADRGMTAPQLVRIAPPVLGASGAYTSPSLDAVVTAAVAAGARGKVAVVTHRDLAKHAVLRANAKGWSLRSRAARDLRSAGSGTRSAQARPVRSPGLGAPNG